jgi:molybdopterin/thiamine biosynthesis adenylyltransferase
MAGMREELGARLRQRSGAGAPLTLAEGRFLAAEYGLSLRDLERVGLEAGVVPLRYARNVRAIGPAGQGRLLACRAAVVGLGGLGGHVIESLARVGIGAIVGIDPDVIEESNLNRQLLSNVDRVGRRKVDCARVRVAEVNPAVEFSGHAVRFQDVPDAALGVCDVAFDCLDSVADRRELAARCGTLGVTLVHGAVAGWAGQVGVCGPGGRLVERLYEGVERGVEHREGALPFAAAVAANVMVARAAALLLEAEADAVGRVLLFDLLGDDWEGVSL